MALDLSVKTKLFLIRKKKNIMEGITSLASRQKIGEKNIPRINKAEHQCGIKARKSAYISVPKK